MDAHLNAKPATGIVIAEMLAVCSEAAADKADNLNSYVFAMLSSEFSSA